MIRKIKLWWLNRRHKTPETEVTTTSVLDGTYTYEQLENAYSIGYNDGKRDGLSIARQQATKSLKEILSWQNQNKNQK